MIGRALLLLAAAAQLCCVAVVAVTGVLPLDSVTFDKIVDGSTAVLVKFDKKYPYGEKEDAWKAFAGQVAAKEGILLAEVGVNDYGEKENDDLRERFGVSADDFPVFKLFRKGHEAEPVAYPKDQEVKLLGTFLKANVEGLWLGLDGTIEQLDALAQKFVAADGAQRTAILKEAEAAAGKFGESKQQQKDAKTYLKTMKRIVERGADYPSKEVARLTKLMGTRITDKKKAQFQRRVNIVSSFVGADAAAKAEL